MVHNTVAAVQALELPNHAEDGSSAVHRDKTRLKNDLKGWQIFMIAIGGVIGVTLFSTHGEILRLAGPGGLLIATLYVALTMICVMECIGELVILWPVSNAMVEYVSAFVDKDLAIVIGIAYWYTFSCIFATLIIVAAELSKAWITHLVWRGVVFYGVIPGLLLLINLMGVKWYGWVEGIGGIVKLGMVATGIVVLIIDAVKAKSTNIDDGFQHEESAARTNKAAICVSIPLIAYGYIGTEIVSVTAFEAEHRSDLRFPARFISYTIAGLYLLSALLQSVTVSWTSVDLQNVQTTSPWLPVIRVATNTYNSQELGIFFEGCIIYFCISAANTALYVSSRTLFGLTRGLNRRRGLPTYLKIFKYLGTTTPHYQVPHYALIVSFLAFYWLIPLQTLKRLGISDMLAIMSTTASIGGILVWASQCIAYIRYHHWFHKFKKIGNLPPAYNRWVPNRRYPHHRSRMLLASISPLPAWFGLVGCFLVVFVFSTANWWVDGNVTLKKLATAYAGPIILSVIYIILKFWNGRWRPRHWFVKLDTKLEDLNKVIRNFERNSNFRFDGLDGDGDGENGVVQELEPGNAQVREQQQPPKKPRFLQRVRHWTT